MCDSSSTIQKWTCAACTYENFPSSLKCTMCSGLKPRLNSDQQSASDNAEGNDHPMPAEDFINAHNYNELFIAQQQQLQQQQHHQQQQQHLQIYFKDVPKAESQNITLDIIFNKWRCKACTYLNWPRSLRCIQCYTKRDELIPEVLKIDEIAAAAVTPNNSNHETEFLSEKNFITDKEANQLQENLKSMHLISNSVTELNATNNAMDTTVKYKNEANNLIDDDGINTFDSANDKPINLLSTSQNQQQSHAPIALNHQQQQQKPSLVPPQSQLEHFNKVYDKWACNICTYENWQKSLKCSMCSTPRESLDVKNTTTIPDSNKITIEKDDNHNIVPANNAFDKNQSCQIDSLETPNKCDTVSEWQIPQRIHQNKCQMFDWRWLNACIGVVENNIGPVEVYLACGGNPGRSLSICEVNALNRNSVFDVGHTLIHLAIRYHRENMLPMLLAQISGNNTGTGIKRVPSYVAPDLATNIRRNFANALRIRKSGFNCQYVNEHATFALPAEIEDLPLQVKEQLYDELLDRDAQKELENMPPALNWSLEITTKLRSRLLVLWNRSAGDCLLDSAMQATWGVFDRDNVLRSALSDSLLQCGSLFYQRWREYEMLQAAILHFTLEEEQWEEDWKTLLTLACQPGSSLEQLHIFALAHIFRRPIIVYGVKCVKSFRGEDIGYARFEGLYLPLLWDQNFCIKSPIAFGYTRGHFSALVPTETFARIDARCDESGDIIYLPLIDCEAKLLPVHFLTQNELGREEAIIRQWLDVCVTEGGLLVAQQKFRRRPLLVAQMLEEWLNHYRNIAQIIIAPFLRRPQQTRQLSDDGFGEE